MTASSVSAASGYATWHQIEWSGAHRVVGRLQARIAKAVRERRWGKVKALQWLLTRSFSGRAIAVKQITENQGKKTPGVDKVTWQTPEAKAHAIGSLRRKGYTPQPLRRVFIPKTNGKLRPLGIPTMKDRAMQALYLLALSPIAETQADSNSYGFRVGRATRDAAGQCFIALAKRHSPQWVLDADISGCFDHISHEWMLANIPVDKAILHKWLKAGFVWQGGLFPTDEGTPQGGIISPTLANMTLDGIEALLHNRFDVRLQGTRKNNPHKVHLIRYADDFVVTGATKETLEAAKTTIENFLQERGLKLSAEKTQIVHIEDGFDFLGWTIRKFDGKLLIKPAKKNVKTFVQKIRKVIETHKAAKQEALITKLNPMIRGWAYYHRNQVAKETFSKVDCAIWQKLWQWARRRHPNKSSSWVKSRYFTRIGMRDWVFSCEMQNEDGSTRRLTLAFANSIAIERHIKIRGEANPFDPAWATYFEDRLALTMKNTLTGKRRILHLWTNQAGRCPHCRALITKETGWHLRHIVPKALGGADITSNLILLHPTCYRQIYHLDSKTNRRLYLR